jgi:hypothetical protein
MSAQGTVYGWTLKLEGMKTASISKFDKFWFCRVTMQLKLVKMDLWGNHPFKTAVFRKKKKLLSIGFEPALAQSKRQIWILWHMSPAPCRSRSSIDRATASHYRGLALDPLVVRSHYIPRGKCPWANFKAYILIRKKTGWQQVSNLQLPCATDFDSVLITTWLILVKINLRRSHPWLNVEVSSNRKILVAGMFWGHGKWNRFSFCCRNHLAKTSQEGKNIL